MSDTTQKIINALTKANGDMETVITDAGKAEKAAQTATQDAQSVIQFNNAVIARLKSNPVSL